MFSFNPLSYILSGLLAVSGVFGGVQYFQKNSIQSELQDKKIEILHLQKQDILMKNSIEEQNSKIESLKSDRAKKEEQLKEWKAKPTKIRYKVLYKTKYLEVKSNDCKDIKNSLNAVRRINYNSL